MPFGLPAKPCATQRALQGTRPPFSSTVHAQLCRPPVREYSGGWITQQAYLVFNDCCFCSRIKITKFVLGLGHKKNVTKEYKLIRYQRYGQ